MYDNFYEPEVIINYLTLTGGGFGFSGDLKLRSYQDLIDNDEGRISRINQIVESDFQFLWLSPKKLDMTIIKDLNVDDVSGVIQNCVDDIEKLNDSQFKTEELSKILKTYSKDKKLKLPSLMMLLRYFLSGSKIGPGVAEMICALGKTNTIERLNNSLKHYTNIINSK
ncbi:hypothetical protein KUTeg_018632 [Tegillarca granosa]|uniref:Aminoacyl-tRNA synthetase class I anticodon-binding domain-containing protein n=1 Tax=Tegillarca granosa TaxID=220873 RepID=A0ABQ9EGN7_TEGGR|nr:hypothetical protein KUTeg_018632 [Tegillarca granosa]